MPHPHRKSFTLIELLIAVSIFSILIVACATVYINFQASKRRAELIRYIKNEGKFLMKRIEREIKNGTVDYEEYYNSQVNIDDYYASEYGEYGKTFFNFGNCYDGTFFLDFAGVRCDDDCDRNKSYWTDACPSIDYDSKDLNVWKSPDINDNALKDGSFQDELYIIDGSGTKRTFLKNKLLNNPNLHPTTYFSLSMLKLDGRDENSNSIIDSWYCSKEFQDFTGKNDTNCHAKSATYISKGNPSTDMSNTIDKSHQSFFVSITPEKLYISQLKFFISPLEDPRKAQAEDLSEVYVTIILGVKPLDRYARAIPGDIPEYIMQSTATVGAKNFIQSWHGVLQN